MPDATQLAPRIAALFESKLNVRVPSFEIDLIETGLVDSLTVVEILAQLEQEFGIHMSLDDLVLDHFRSIAHIATFVAAKTQNGTGSNHS